MINPGTRIGYTADFLHSIQASFEIAERRGTFIGTEPMNAHGITRFARVVWDDGDGRTSPVALANIAPVGSFRFSHNS